MLRWVFVALLVAGPAGCAGSQSKTAGATPAGAASKAASRRDRDRMRALETEIYALKGKLNAVEPMAVPRLPVEVLEPEEAAPLPGSEPLGDTLGDTFGAGLDGFGAAGDVPVGEANPDVDVALIEDNGVEVVYIGEAARERSVKPRVPPELRAAQGEPANVRAPPARAGGQPARAEPLPEIVRPGEGDRLAVTDRVGPTVENQLRAARLPAGEMPRPRSASAVIDVPQPKSRQARRGPAPAGQGTAATAVDSPQALYRRHYDALRAGDHASAIAGFRAFIGRFSDHELTDNALYWLGEAFYDQRDYRTALTEFRRVVTDHPQGNKVPDALLKIGYCYIALGEPAKARSVLTQLIAIYPKSSPAVLAAERLQTLAD